MFLLTFRKTRKRDKSVGGGDDGGGGFENIKDAAAQVRTSDLKATKNFNVFYSNLEEPKERNNNNNNEEYENKQYTSSVKKDQSSPSKPGLRRFNLLSKSGGGCNTNREEENYGRKLFSLTTYLHNNHHKHHQHNHHQKQRSSNEHLRASSKNEAIVVVDDQHSHHPQQQQQCQNNPVNSCLVVGSAASSYSSSLVVSSSSASSCSSSFSSPPPPTTTPHSHPLPTVVQSQPLQQSSIVVQQPHLVNKLHSLDMSLSSSNSASNLVNESPFKTTTTTTNGTALDSSPPSAMIGPSSTKSANQLAASSAAAAASLSYLDDNNLKLAVIDFSDLNKIIKLHSSIDLQEWVAFKTKMYFDQINVLYGAIGEHCTPQTCPTMSAPNNPQIQWTDEKNKKCKYSASQYIDTCLTYAAKLLSDEAQFPTKMGHQFPANFDALVKRIHRHLFQIMAHMYHAHYKELVHLKLNTYLNSIYFHFYLFNRTYAGALLDEKDFECMDALNKALMRKYRESTGQNHVLMPPSGVNQPTIHQSTAASSSSSSGGFSFFKKKLNFNIMA